MEKVKVDKEKCIGCGACVAVSPENFDFNEEGLSIVINDEVNEKTIEAIELCPVFAISKEEDQSDNDNRYCNECCENECQCDDDNCCCNECNECCEDECQCDENCTCEGNCHCDSECNCESDCSCGCKCDKE